MNTVYLFKDRLGSQSLKIKYNPQIIQTEEARLSNLTNSLSRSFIMYVHTVPQKKLAITKT